MFLALGEIGLIGAQKREGGVFVSDIWIGNDLFDTRPGLRESVRDAQVFEDDLFVRGAVKCVWRVDGALTEFEPCGIPDPGGIIEFDRAGVLPDLVGLIGDEGVVTGNEDCQNDEGDQFIQYP